MELDLAFLTQPLNAFSEEYEFNNDTKSQTTTSELLFGKTGTTDVGDMRYMTNRHYVRLSKQLDYMTSRTWFVIFDSSAKDTTSTHGRGEVFILNVTTSSLLLMWWIVN